METNYEKENEQFETWWNRITAKSDKWTTLERMAAHDAWMEARNEQLDIPVVISCYLTKEKFVILFIIIPLFLLGLHLGAIITHISLNFSFVFPIFFRLTGILTGIWIWLGIYLYSKNYKKLEK
jgi:hypothetical protein